MTTLVMQGPELTPAQAQAIADRLNARLEPCARGHFRAQIINTIDADTLNRLSQEYHADLNLLADSFDPTTVRLVISDMDSTLINIECIDEIADFAGIKPQVSAITEATMHGELNFEQSLTKRVGLLTGLDAGALDHVYRERLRPNPGAETMIAGLHAKGVKVALVSGGFTYFTEQLKTQLKLDYARGNTLDIIDNKLTGKILGNIVGAEGKRDFLLELCSTLDITPKQAIAIGDGANDLIMMKEAGLSIAYHAKPKVQAQAHTVLNHCGLEGVLSLLNLPH
ncbi:MAG: phosphoserine phosphatase SerB [Gammaproteobacteria bacterium]|nr:phosphoserine phosphatase SerB [Gammaproteobacteria bacterium]